MKPNRFVAKKHMIVIENYQFNTTKWINRIYNNQLLTKIFDYLYEQLLTNGMNSKECIQLQKICLILEQFTLEDLNLLFTSNLTRNELMSGPISDFINDVMKV